MQTESIISIRLCIVPTTAVLRQITPTLHEPTPLPPASARLTWLIVCRWRGWHVLQDLGWHRQGRDLGRRGGRAWRRGRHEVTVLGKPVGWWSWGGRARRRGRHEVGWWWWRWQGRLLLLHDRRWWLSLQRAGVLEGRRTRRRQPLEGLHDDGGRGVEEHGAWAQKGAGRQARRQHL